MVRAGTQKELKNGDENILNKVSKCLDTALEKAGIKDDV